MGKKSKSSPKPPQPKPPPPPEENVTKSELPPEKKASESESISNSKEISTKCSLHDCPSPAVSKCGGCSKASYCSREHQKLHWKDHKGECCAWKIEQNSTLGRYLVAVRDVKPGEVVIQEKPLLITPPKVTLPVCLGCYSEFKQDGVETDDGHGVKPVACRNGCGWPMCKSTICSSSHEHEGECTLSKGRGGVTIRTANVEHPLYQVIGILRALGLQDKDPTSFEKLMSLEANVEKRAEFTKAMEQEAAEQGQEVPGSSRSGGTGMTPEVGVKIIQDFFQRPEISEEWILKLGGIIETNGHEIPIPDQDGHINRRVIGVYHTSSFLEHNCRPNCVKTWDLNTKEIVIRASVFIKKGGHLSISYVDPMWGIQDRVSLLRMTKFFTCTCPRCKDPTELGVHVSSLRCQHLKCMNNPKLTPGLPKYGMIIPLDPYKPDGGWKCQSCTEDYNISYVGSLITKVGQEMDELHDKVGDISAKEEFLKRFGKNLSPNHFYLLEIKVELAQLYGRTSDDPIHMMGPVKLLRKIQLCEELLLVLNTISPGYNRLRALILYELQAGVLMLSRLRRSIGEISLEKHLEEMMQCGKWMTEVIKVLGWESERSIERKRAAGAQRDLEQLKSAVLSLQNQTEEVPSTPKVNSGESSAQQGSSLDKKDDPPRSHLSAEDDSFIEEVF